MSTRIVFFCGADPEGTGAHESVGGDVRGGVVPEVTHVVVCGKGTVQTTNMLTQVPPGGYD